MKQAYFKTLKLSLVYMLHFEQLGKINSITSFIQKIFS